MKRRFYATLPGTARAGGLERRTIPRMVEDAVRVLPGGVVLRDLAGQAELDAAVRLQEATWGEGFRERVPGAILLVAQKIGGIAAGAFAPGERASSVSCSG